MKLKGNNMEVKYQELLILAYFKSHYKKYEFNEILKMMGMTYKELSITLEHLLKLSYLVHYENYLVISKQREKLLQEEKLGHFYEKNDIITQRKEMWAIDKPYIPQIFKF